MNCSFFRAEVAVQSLWQIYLAGPYRFCFEAKPSCAPTIERPLFQDTESQHICGKYTKRHRVLVNPPCNGQFNATLENHFNIADQFSHQLPLSPPSVLCTRPPLLSCPLANRLRKPSSQMHNSFSRELFDGFLAGTGCPWHPLLVLRSRLWLSNSRTLLFLVFSQSMVDLLPCFESVRFRSAVPLQI